MSFLGHPRSIYVLVIYSLKFILFYCYFMFLYTTHLFILFVFMPMLIPICLHPLFCCLLRPAVCFVLLCFVLLCFVLLFLSSSSLLFLSSPSCFKFVYQNSYNRGFSTYNYIFVTYTNLKTFTQSSEVKS